MSEPLERPEALAALRGALMHAAPGGRVTLALNDGNSAAASPDLLIPSGATPEEILQVVESASGPGRLPRTVALGEDRISVGFSLADAPARSAGAMPNEAEFADRDAVVRGRVALVTGAAQGFGAEIATYLVRAGALVVLVDLNAEGVDDRSRQLNDAHGPVTIPVAADVSSEESVASLFAEVAEKAGGLDLLVSNAGIVRAGSVKELGLPEFDLVTRVNYNGFFLCTKYASRLMAAQNATAPANATADIVQINSKSGLAGSNKNGAYAGSKFGGIGLVQSFALELAADRIKVNAICPGNFLDGPLWSDPEKGLFVQYLEAGKVPGATSVGDVKRHYESQVPLGRGCTGEDVCRALLYIVEQQYETGQAVPVTGGQIMLS